MGQFPIDYIPEKFVPITQEQANSLPMPDSNRQLEFNLMLNGAQVKATDSHNNDDKNQVKVNLLTF